MAFANKIELSDFSGGLISDLEAAKIPASAASTLQNADIRNKFLQTLPGVTEVNTGLNASFIKISEEQFLFTEPSEEAVTLVYGTLSGADKLYVRPYLNSGGTWTDAWLELTEKEGNYTDSVISGVTLQSNSLLSSTNDYYNGWIVYCVTSDRGSAVVTDYVGSTKTLTLSWAIPSMASGNTFFLVRNPVYNTNGTILFNPSSNGCQFLQRGNSIDIVTGGDAIYDSTVTPNKTDLHLSVQSGYQALDDIDLNFTGFYLTRKPPTSPHQIAAFSEVSLDTGDEFVPQGTYIVMPVCVYDGFQESPLAEGRLTLDATTFDTTNPNIGALSTTASSSKIRASITLFYGKGSSDVPLLTPDQSGADDFGFLIFDRRITAIRFYMVEASALSIKARPVSEWRFVKEVKINSADWSGSGPSYTQSVDINGQEFAAGAGIDISDRQGHASLKVHANASFIASAKKRVAVANVYADEKRQSFVFFSAINSDEQNTPDVIPHTSFLDLNLYGIPKIMGFIEALGFYVAIGENQLVKIDASTLAVDKNIQARGVSAPNALVNANGLLYFCNLEDIYYYHPSQDVIRSIATGFIREAWRGLATANKQAAAIGYDKRFEMLIVAAGSTIYTYNLPAAYASDLATDTQAIGSWQVYSVNKTFNRFYTDLTGRCIGIANDGKSYELFSSGIANTMTFEKVLGENDLNLHTLRLTYEASATVTAKIFDKTRNDTYPIRTFTFPAQSKHKRYDIHKGAHVKRPLLQITASVGTKISEIVVNPDSLTDLR